MAKSAESRSVKIRDCVKQSRVWLTLQRAHQSVVKKLQRAEQIDRKRKGDVVVRRVDCHRGKAAAVAEYRTICQKPGSEGAGEVDVFPSSAYY